jgi:hypothetical protein
MKLTKLPAAWTLAVAGLSLFGGQAIQAKQAPKTAPASVSKIEGTDQMRVTVLPEAARRLDIQTAPVGEKTITPTLQVGGEVISVTPERNSAIVRVELSEDEMSRVLRDETAFILPLARDSRAPRVQAVPLSGIAAQTLSLDRKPRRIRALPLKKPTESGLLGLPGMMHYEVSTTDHAMEIRQLVLVELALPGAGEKRKTVPYAAVLYDAKGKTWVYTNPEPLAYVRQSIQIDTVAGDEALLLDGPPIGTAVVTVGATELYGTEFGVGK